MTSKSHTPIPISHKSSIASPNSSKMTPREPVSAQTTKYMKDRGNTSQNTSLEHIQGPSHGFKKEADNKYQLRKKLESLQE